MTILIFIDKEIDTFNQVEDIIQPLQKVTKELLKKAVKRNAQVEHKKLNWALNNINEDFALEFKRKYEDNSFKTVKSA